MSMTIDAIYVIIKAYREDEDEGDSSRQVALYSFWSGLIQYANTCSINMFNYSIKSIFLK